MNWKADEINNQMGQISIDNKSEVPGYGGVYWQYFENLENIKTDSTSTLSITKNVFNVEALKNGCSQKEGFCLTEAAADFQKWFSI